jgi:hypothetical protein
MQVSDMLNNESALEVAKPFLPPMKFQEAQSGEPQRPVLALRAGSPIFSSSRFSQGPALHGSYPRRTASTPPLMMHQSPVFNDTSKFDYKRSNSLFENFYPSPESVPASPAPSYVSLLNNQPEKKKFACPEEGCHKSFTRRYNLSAHLRCHRLERPYECTQCTQAFARKHDLQRHVRSLHDVNKIYGPCSYCGLHFTRSDALGRHLRKEERRDAITGQIREMVVGCKNAVTTSNI